MSFPPHTRSSTPMNHAALVEDLDFEESEAEYTNSEAPRSSPAPSLPAMSSPIRYSVRAPDTLWLDDEEDGDFTLPKQRAPRLSDEQKALLVLRYMRQSFSRFSLRLFLETCFKSSNKDIRNFTGTFLEDGGAICLMKLWWGSHRRGDWGKEMVDWVMERACQECEKECSALTDRASAGPYPAEAAALKVPSHSVSVPIIRDFTYDNLLRRYERVTPRLQQLLKAAIGKEGQPENTASRNPDHGRTTITSMILNLRSREVNYLACVNVLTLWQLGAPKRLVQILNRLGFCSSYEYQGRAVVRLGEDALRLARLAANNDELMKLLAYDNFNWRSFAWETSAMHGTLKHDQVSALLIILRAARDTTLARNGVSGPSLPLSARNVMSVGRFDAGFGRRHELSAEASLQRILPTLQDQQSFRRAVIIHIQNILVSDIRPFARFQNSVPKFDDPHAIIPHKTERHWLPTFDQEQGSTRGNMQVLEHYLLDVLRMRRSSFEGQAIVVLGDRLTTARDRAAQDQRALDRSTDRADHLSSIKLASGMMHQCLNMVINIARNHFGDKSNNDAVSLHTLRNHLPNREGLNLNKVDFYAWLRFLDVVLRALTITACLVALDVRETGSSLKTAVEHFTPSEFQTLCTDIADRFFLASPNSLEAQGVKTISGDTMNGHAVSLAHSLVTLREMRNAIKYGHPTRMLRMLKYWTPMFYAGGSYNYSNEDMELLHNLLDEWPDDAAGVILAGMLVNNTGRDDGFKEGDLEVEHLNKSIKDRAHGANASPALLEKVTPALGQVQELTQHICDELGVDALNQRHSHVHQEKDVGLLVTQLLKANVFDFGKDVKSAHSAVPLYPDGLRKLAGASGGHAKHLARHKLRLRARHTFDSAEVEVLISESDREVLDELTTAIDSPDNQLDYSIVDDSDAVGTEVLVGSLRTEMDHSDLTEE